MSAGVSGGDPWAGDPRILDYFAASYETLATFHALLTDQGVLRGLIGPHEASKLWERHFLNSAAVVPFLPRSGRLIDVGSGAGLPGIVLAVMLPEVEVTLLEPMERRTQWLSEACALLGLSNVTIRRGRAEELHGELHAEAVTARAVAPLDRLARWTLPLLVQGGVLVALKGRQAQEEISKARFVIKKLGGGVAELHQADTFPGVDSTTIVRVVRETVRGSAKRVARTSVEPSLLVGGGGASTAPGSAVAHQGDGRS